MMVELESIPNPEFTRISEWPSELSSTDLPGTMQKNNRIELLEEDGNTTHLRSVRDSYCFISVGGRRFAIPLWSTFLFNSRLLEIY